MGLRRGRRQPTVREETDVERLLQDAAIVRHGGKIRSTINNAHRALELIDRHGSLAAYLWPHATFGEPPSVAPTTPTSVAIAEDLKKRGWTFVGPTTVYAFMQAMGIVNDHSEGCALRPKAEKRRRRAAFRVAREPLRGSRATEKS